MRTPLAPLALAVLLSAAACERAAEAPPADRTLDRIDAELREAVGEARAQAVTDCRPLAYGAKACGGPSQTLVYSQTDGDPERVRRLAEEYTALEDEINRRENRESDCMLLMEPTPALEGGRCVAGPPAGP